MRSVALVFINVFWLYTNLYAQNYRLTSIESDQVTSRDSQQDGERYEDSALREESKASQYQNSIQHIGDSLGETKLYAKNGFNVGFGLALMPLIQSHVESDIFDNDYPLGAGYSIKIGYTYFSNPFVGFRIYGEYSSISSTHSYYSLASAHEYSDNRYRTQDYNVHFYNIGGNILIDTDIGRYFNQTIGIIIDVSTMVGFTFTQNWQLGMNRGSNYIYAQGKILLGIGLSYSMLSKHRFELMLRRMTDIYDNHSTTNLTLDNQNTIIFSQITTTTLGYIYTF